MSRRFRLEQEYLRQLKQEGDEEDEKVRQQQQKFTAPILWASLKSGFHIVDVVERDFDEVLQMVTEHFVPNDVLCRNSDIEEDPVSMKSMMDHVLFTLRDTTSIKAVHVDEDGNETMAGALLLRVSRQQDHDRVFSRTILQEGEARKKCIAIQTALSRKIDIFKLYNCEAFLRYYMVCIKDEFRKHGLGYQLMRIGMEVARSLGLRVCSGIFNTYKLQRLAKRLGFTLIQEVSYINWRDSENEIIFSDPGSGNYTCALMVAEIPTEPITDPNVVTKLAPVEQRVVVQPRTRAEKRAKLAKSQTFDTNSSKRS